LKKTCNTSILTKEEENGAKLYIKNYELNLGDCFVIMADQSKIYALLNFP